MFNWKLRLTQTPGLHSNPKISPNLVIFKSQSSTKSEVKNPYFVFCASAALLLNLVYIWEWIQTLFVKSCSGLVWEQEKANE